MKRRTSELWRLQLLAAIAACVGCFEVTDNLDCSASNRYYDQNTFKCVDCYTNSIADGTTLGRPRSTGCKCGINSFYSIPNLKLVTADDSCKAPTPGKYVLPDQSGEASCGGNALEATKRCTCPEGRAASTQARSSSTSYRADSLRLRCRARLALA